MTRSHRGREAAQGPLGHEPGSVCSGPAAPAPFSSGFLLLLQSLPQAEEGTESGGLGAIPALPAGRSLSWAPCHPVGKQSGTWGELMRSGGAGETPGSPPETDVGREHMQGVWGQDTRKQGWGQTGQVRHT